MTILVTVVAHSLWRTAKIKAWRLWKCWPFDSDKTAMGTKRSIGTNHQRSLMRKQQLDFSVLLNRLGCELSSLPALRYSIWKLDSNRLDTLSHRCIRHTCAYQNHLDLKEALKKKGAYRCSRRHIDIFSPFSFGNQRRVGKVRFIMSVWFFLYIQKYDIFLKLLIFKVL